MKNKEKEVIDDYGFILSYGDADGIIPMGVYKMDNILLPDNNNPYEYGAAYNSLTDCNTDSFRFSMVKLVKVNSDKKTNENSVIYIPLLEFLKLVNLDLDIDENNYLAERFVQPGVIDDDALLYLNDFMQSYYKHFKLSLLNFRQRATLDYLNATYEENGEPLGTNYTIVPFSYGSKKLTYVKKYSISYSDDEQEDLDKGNYSSGICKK